MTIRRLTALSTLVAASIPTAALLAQGAPSPEKQAACMQEFVPLRDDAEQKGRLVKAAAERLTPPREACELISTYTLASAKMINYVETNAVECGIPASLVDQLKTGYRKTDDLRSKVCAKADQSGRLKVPPGSTILVTRPPRQSAF